MKIILPPPQKSKAHTSAEDECRLQSKTKIETHARILMRAQFPTFQFFLSQALASSSAPQILTQFAIPKLNHELVRLPNTLLGLYFSEFSPKSWETSTTSSPSRENIYLRESTRVKIQIIKMGCWVKLSVIALLLALVLLTEAKYSKNDVEVRTNIDFWRIK